MTQAIVIPTKRVPSIRPAEAKDIPQIAHVAATTFTSSFGHSMPASDLQAHVKSAYSHSAFEKDLKNPLIDIFVAHEENDPEHVKGFIQLTEGTTEPCLEGIENLIELQRLYIDEKYQGSGVGGALMRHVERLAKERGFANMWLGVWEENFKAQKAYERFGFRKVGAHDFVMGECVQTDWILIKSL